MNLLENYKKRIQVAESIYSKSHDGEMMDSNRKLAIAKCIQNTTNFLNEAFDSTSGVQRSDMGLYKKFCVNLINVALPNLIAPDLVMVSPMSSMSGYVTYVNYSAGVTKGETQQGDLFNNPFALGKVDANYTGEAVVEANASASSANVTLAWAPVVKGAFTTYTIGGVEKELTALEINALTAAEKATEAHKDVKIVAADGTITYANVESDGKTVNSVPGKAKVAYKYDNVIIPQDTIPTLTAKIEAIPLVAKARRIAIYYSQMAAFQSKTDYGLNLEDQLSEKAVGQLQYEIDTEITNLLIDVAGAADLDLTWSKTLPVGVNKKDHYNGFAEIVEIANQKIYDRTKRFAATYMLCASNIKPVLALMDGFTAASTANINGPYFAGTLNGIKVYITPNILPGKFALGVNGDDYMTSVAVYAPYMPVVPTAALQFADGGTTQGFSTLYDLKVLNKDLIIAGEVTA